jgi:hypothetical protein
MRSFGFCVVVLGCAAMSWGQAAVEYTVGAGAATGAAAGAKGAGQAVGGVFGAVTQTLNKANAPGGPGAPAAAASSISSVAPGGVAKATSVATKPIDPSQITVGMDRNDLLARFGEPSTRTSQIRRSQMLDTFWYSTTTKDELIVSLADGKVVSTVLASQRKRTVASATRK